MKLTLMPLVAAILLSVQAARADDNNHLSITVGDWPPYFDQEAHGQGMVARLVRDIFSEEGYTVSFRFLPWKRAYYEAALGRHDATAVWMHEADREKDFIYSEPVLSERFVLFHRKGDPILWDDLADLESVRLGGSIGYSYGTAFDNAVDAGVLDVEWVASPELNFRRLVRGRIDAFPEEINVGYHILRRELTPSAAREIVHHPRAILENKSFLLFPRATDFESRELLGKFNRRLQAFRDSGRYQRYFNTEEHAAALLPADQAAPARLKSAPIITPEW